MYNELHEVWKRELESVELERLPADFYSLIVDYLRRLREEKRMLDKRTVKASLLEKESKNARRMVKDLVQVRYKKMAKQLAKGEKIPADVLAPEEEKLYAKIAPLAEVYKNFAKNILRGHVLSANVEQKQKRAVVRFLKDTPSIIGADVKPYGPFKIEDVASLPVENAKIMVKQGLAEKVEAS